MNGLSRTIGEERIGSLETTAEPLLLTEKQSELCRRLDQFYASANKTDVRASDLFRGALYAMQPRVRSANPDWMAQAAHSLRELIYPFYQSKSKNKKKDVFAQYGTAGDIDNLTKKIGLHLGFLTSVAHHNWAEAKGSPLVGLTLNLRKPEGNSFEEVISDFENVLFQALRRQLDAHSEIDEFINDDNRDIAQLKELININFDTRQYFFATAHDRYLDWLDQNGFFEPIRQPVNEALSYSYRTPELDFLSRVALTSPDKVVDVMLSVSISLDRFNPEVLNGFLWIARNLSAKELARIVRKIRDDSWPELMARFKLHSFDYESMFKTLSEAKDDESILVLAKAVLAVKARDRQEDTVSSIFNREIFCVRDLFYTKVFQYIADVGLAHREAAFALAAGCFRDVLLTENAEAPPFAIDDHYLLFDKNLFELSIGDTRHYSDKDSVEDLVALLINLARKIISTTCENESEARRLYETYLSLLPDSQSSWRLRLVILSLCPHAFRGELRDYFFRIFNCEAPHRLVSGAEYCGALNIGFSALSPQERSLYVTKIKAWLSSDAGSGRHTIWCIYSSIYENISAREREEVEQVLGEPLKKDFEPRPSFEHAKGGWVNPRAPITIETLSEMPVAHIADKLKGEWSPNHLRKLDVERDFLNPLNADGMARLLKADLSTRPAAYIAQSGLFLDPEALHPHYTYSFLSGVSEALRDNKLGEPVDWSPFIQLMMAVVERSRKGMRAKSNEHERGNTWLAGWDGVLQAMGKVVEELLKNKHIGATIATSYRPELISIVCLLLANPDPTAEYERETRNDAFSIAINSTRGQALQVFLQLVYRDAPVTGSDVSSSVAVDLREIYTSALCAETTMAIRFLFGYYLFFMHLKDRNWVEGLLPVLFPADALKKDLYLATWEGYLTNQLYLDIFLTLREYYRRAVLLNPTDYTRREYHTKLDAGLARHLAVGFMHVDAFGLDDELFQLFWRTPNTERHSEFISLIGRSAILRQEKDEEAQSSKIDFGKLRAFWDWALANVSEKETLAAFGYWMNADTRLFESRWLASRVLQTLKKTGGTVDFEFKMMEMLHKLVVEAPEDVLAILRLHLLIGRVSDPSKRGWTHVNDELVSLFKTLYETPQTQDGTRRLINDLLSLGNGQYWRLKEALR